MDIVMLGHSAAGKTTYVSLMYAAMRDGIQGFSLRTDDVLVHGALTSAAEAVLRGRYPDVSSRRQVFEFVLQYQGRDVLPFRWRDYRGGALTERRADSPQAGQLQQDLVEAEGIVVFVDAHRLLTDGGSDRYTRRMTVLVQRALEARGDQLTPLVLAFTKSDLLDLDRPGLLDRLVEPFDGLIAGVARTQHLRGAVAMVACGPDPVNVAVPVLWSLHYGIVGRGLALEASIEESLASARRAAANDTAWDRISSWWKEESSWAEISARHERAAQAEYERLEPLFEPAERLAGLLDGVPNF
ncbi:TRAFAC clade GTPase domain-containing protein [Streptomyces erythrochromogenes]|uniref:TRAFAC clade GTPase domain-containing protein n=1 Tax=Streptomyces erythrochromogenes TaxID=285574 RepID=UPI00369B7DED